MGDEYFGIKYYGKNDLSYGYNLNASIELLDSVEPDKDSVCINEILEWYNVTEILECVDSLTEEQSSKVERIKRRVAVFFKSINDETFIQRYCSVSHWYLDDFWMLFDKYQCFKDVSESAFVEVFEQPNFFIQEVLERKRLVNEYDSVIADYFRNYSNTAEIILDKYFRKEGNNSDYFIPKSLNVVEYEEIFNRYIELDEAHIGYLGLLASSQSRKDCPISDTTRLKARKKVENYWKNNTNGAGFTYSVEVRYSNNPEMISIEKNENNETVLVYDKEWFMNNLDYPTILNNFIYFFSYVDLCFRCTFPSIKSELSVLEKTIGIRGKKDYEIGIAFQFKNMKSLIEIQSYSTMLLENSISIESLVSWFFSEYLPEEFGVVGFVVNMPSSGFSFIEKCRSISSEMDSVLKQFNLYVQHLNVDRELFEISSNPVVFNDIPSLIPNKYAYSNNEDVEKEQFLLFSDQCLLNYLPKYGTGFRSFFELLSRVHDVKIDDYPTYELQNLKWLINRGAIELLGDGTIKMNKQRVHLLHDLFQHEVLRTSFYVNNHSYEKMLADGDLKCESRLFTKPESSYLNYVLNKHEYSNGLDLRNRYIHGSYPLSEKQQKIDYMTLLKIMIVVVLKMNEEFCCSVK